MSTNIMSENEKIFARLLDFFSESKINQAKFIEMTGYSSGQASAIFNRKANLNKRLIKTICTSFSISENWLLTGRGEQVETVGEKPAEYGEGYIAAVAAMMREMDADTQKDIFLSVQKEKLLRELLKERQEKKVG